MLERKLKTDLLSRKFLRFSFKLYFDTMLRELGIHSAETRQSAVLDTSVTPWLSTAALLSFWCMNENCSHALIFLPS